MWWSTLCCLCAVVCSVWADADARESRLVNIAQGPVRGYKDAESGVYFFQSIPYASAPTGTNRFKAPLSPPTWEEPLEAISKNMGCPQLTLPFFDLPTLNQQEDCLIANVYVPDTPEKNLSVVVYIHGGAFQLGNGDWMIPSKLVAENSIIAVTFNYRIGIHGFLCLGTEDIPGNAGMKDQIAALRWVKNNINRFNGNPDDVTIAGYSAGSASVNLLMLSKSAEGLFNKVISESGASIAQWTIQSDPLENAKRYAKYLNFTNEDDVFALENFYKTASFELLTSLPFLYNIDSTFGPSPCIERTTEREVFLDKSPVEILKSNDYKKNPMLYGFANMEGLQRIDFFGFWKHKMNRKFSDFLPPDLKFESIEQKEKIAKQIKEFYFGMKPVGAETTLGYVDFFTDVIIAYPMLRAVKYHLDAGHDQIYLYDYSFVDENTYTVPHTNVKGANHCAQSAAVFGEMPGYVDPKKSTKEFLTMSKTIRKIWGSFIKTGAPIPEGSPLPAWPAVRTPWAPHMSLGNEISLQGSLLERRARFWDDIYENHYRDPIPPPEPTFA